MIFPGALNSTMLRLNRIAALFLLLAAAVARGDEASSRVPIAELIVVPATIHLNGSNRQQQLLVTAKTASGRLFDVTHDSEISLADDALASLSGSLIHSSRDGPGTVVVRYGETQTSVPLIVEGVATYPPVHFENDMVPLFSKLRCNSGGCHGKQSGQNGFKLSVFGFDPRMDYNALVKEARGRRVFPGSPEQSLLVLKASGRMPHGGGRRTDPGSADDVLMTQWVAQGTPWGDEHAPRLTRIEIEPAERLMTPDAGQQILVTAIYSDGSRRDMTHAAAYTSNAEAVAEVSEQGLVSTGQRPGEAAITVNYMGQIGAMQVLVPRPSAPNPYPQLAVHNPIDQHVWTKLEKLGIAPSPLCDDATFLRRLYLDAIGTLPTADEVRHFLADTDSNKRPAAIDAVLQRPEFADYWALKWSDVLLVNSESLGPRGAYAFHRWLRQQIADNRPYDQWVRELLTASGNSAKNGPVNFYRAMRTPPELTKTVSQAFLGVRLDCAQCHHHPFEIWAQEDFYGLAGFFNGLQHQKLSPDRELVYHAGHQPATMPLTGEVVPTRALAAEPADFSAADPRIALADWLTAADNPWFARLAANRLWKHFLGRGLVEPEDDLRSTNPASNEPLLAYLTEQVVDGGFDLKAVTRLILRSRVYQLSAATNDTNFDDEQNFSHHLVKRLPAEVLLDAICEVTGVPEQFAGAPLGTRSTELWDNRLPSYFLDVFGRSERESPCECAKSSDPTMAQALHLMNAPEIEAKFGDPSGRVSRLIERGLSRDELVAELCLAALGREPTQKDRDVSDALFANQLPQPAAEDYLWTLLNSYEFLFIH